MPRLIDADALYKSFGATGNCNDCPLDAYKCQYYNEHTMMEFCERIDDAPTVDAEPVVRCKDCRFYLQSNEICELVDTRLHFYETDKRWTEDSYCSWGERKCRD